MRSVFYAHWAICIGWLIAVMLAKDGIIVIDSIGFKGVVMGFGSVLVYGCVIISIFTIKYNDEGKFGIDHLYLLSNLISFIARSIFEILLFIYGSSITDKWIVICIFSAIALSPKLIKFLDRKF